MNTFNLLLMAGGQQQGGSSGGFLMLLIIIVIFYFFMIRPQSKRQKEEKKFREQLAKGQKVVTLGGLHGKIQEVKDSTVMLEIAHDVVIEMEKASIAMDVMAAKPAADKK